MLAEALPSDIIPDYISRLADVCFQSMYQNAPWRTGFLAMSITKEVSDNTAQVYPTASYAKYVAKGTAPHAILPRTAKVLAFPPGGDLGGMVFTKRVQHPGTRANPFIKTAAAETRDQSLKIFSDVWNDHIGECME
jgi:hypothetical protein